MSATYEGGDVDEAAASGVCELNIGAEYVDSAGLTVQRQGANTSTADTLVRVERTTAGALHFADTVANGTTGLDLSQLLTSATGAVGAFNALQDIRLWAGSPGDGYASGAVKVRTGTTPNSGGYVWYKSSAMTSRLFDCVIAYPSNSILPSTKTYRLYASDGSTVVRTAVDTLTWSGAVLTQTTRTWS